MTIRRAIIIESFRDGKCLMYDDLQNKRKCITIEHELQGSNRGSGLSDVVKEGAYCQPSCDDIWIQMRGLCTIASDHV